MTSTVHIMGWSENARLRHNHKKFNHKLSSFMDLLLYTVPMILADCAECTLLAINCNLKLKWQIEIAYQESVWECNTFPRALVIMQCMYIDYQFPWI